MSQSPTTSVATPDVTRDAESILAKDGTSHAPDLITEQQVVFSTAVAMSSRRPKFSRRLIGAIGVVGAVFSRRPARPDHPQRFIYIEQSRMAREMDRL